MKRNTTLTLGKAIRKLKDNNKGHVESIHLGINFMNLNPNIVSILLYGLEQNYHKDNPKIVSHFQYTITYDTSDFSSGDFSFIRNRISTELSQILNVFVNCIVNIPCDNSLLIEVFIRTFPTNKG